MLSDKAKQCHGNTIFLDVLAFFWRFINTTFNNSVLAVVSCIFLLHNPNFLTGRGSVCVFFWRNLRENYLKKHFFLVKSIEIWRYFRYGSLIRFVNSGERCWFISTSRTFIFIWKKQQFILVSNNFKNLPGLPKKELGHLKTNFIF